MVKLEGSIYELMRMHCFSEAGFLLFKSCFDIKENNYLNV